MNEEEYEENTDYVAKNDGSMLGMIGLPSDIPPELQEKWFPFINKRPAFANMTNEEIQRVRTDLRLFHLSMYNGRTREQVRKSVSQREYAQVDAYLLMTTSLSRGGMLIRTMRETSRNINRVEKIGSEEKRGWVDQVLGRNKE